MRDGTEMSFTDLRDEAKAAVDDAGKSYAEMGRELDVHRTAVARAVKEAGAKFQKLQRRIIEHLTPYRIERRVTFKAHRDE
jgi:phage tail tape-measure protein